MKLQNGAAPAQRNGKPDDVDGPQAVDVPLCLSKVYGYSLYIIMISTVFAAVLSTIEWTKWLPGKIAAPSYDKHKYVVLFSGVSFSLALGAFQ